MVSASVIASCPVARPIVPVRPDWKVIVSAVASEAFARAIASRSDPAPVSAHGPFPQRLMRRLAAACA
jgi:hypothetical protein